MAYNSIWFATIFFINRLNIRSVPLNRKDSAFNALLKIRESGKATLLGHNFNIDRNTIKTMSFFTIEFFITSRFCRFRMEMRFLVSGVKEGTLLVDTKGRHCCEKYLLKIPAFSLKQEIYVSFSIKGGILLFFLLFIIHL